MPEMPEVEHFKQYFNRTSLRKKINHIVCKNKKLLTGGSLKKINATLKNKSFKKIQRRGKFLIADIAGSDEKVVFHFGLTGYLHYKKSYEKQGVPYAKVIFVFTNGDELQWINKRNLGHVYVLTDINKIKTLKTMGPEATKISAKDFQVLMKAKEKSNIKTFLMDQDTIAGIGNNYSNEILYRAHINPKSMISDLNTAEKKHIYAAMKLVLKQAVHFSISERKEKFPSTWILAHKKDMQCPKNKKHKLKRNKIDGRSALYCPEHQK